MLPTYLKNLVRSNTHRFVPNLRSQIEESRRKEILSFKARMDQKRSLSDKIADRVTNALGRMWFFWFNILFFGLWIAINNQWIPGLPVFDPYPYGMLTTMVSLEAIFLSIFVLVSQNRAAKIDDLREEIDLQINVQAEEEITKILILLDEIHDHLGLTPEDDADLKRMKEKTNLDALEDEISKEM